MAANPFEQANITTSCSGPPSTGDYLRDRGFRFLAVASAWAILALVAYILWEIGGQALPAFQDFGLSFLTSTT